MATLTTYKTTNKNQYPYTPLDRINYISTAPESIIDISGPYTDAETEENSSTPATFSSINSDYTVPSSVML